MGPVKIAKALIKAKYYQATLHLAIWIRGGYLQANIAKGEYIRRLNW